MAEKHRAPFTSYDAFFHGLGRERLWLEQPSQRGNQRRAFVIGEVQMQHRPDMARE